MKKIGKVLFVTILSILVFAGCKMKESMEFEITKDELKLNLIMAFDDEFIDVMLTAQEDENFMSELMKQEKPDFSKAKKHTDAERWAYIDSDNNGLDTDINDKYKSTKYDKNGMKGYIFTIPMGKLEDYTVSSANEKVDLAELFQGDELPTSAPLFIKNGNTYKSNMTYKVESSAEMDEIAKAEDYIEMNVVFNIPNAATSNNAKSTSNGNKTLTYTLFKGGDIDFSFDFDEATADTPKSLLAKAAAGEDVNLNGDTTTTGTTKNETTTEKKDDKTFIYIGIAGVSVAAIIIVILLISGGKKNQVAPVQPVNPIAPSAQPTQPEAPQANQDNTNNQ